MTYAKERMKPDTCSRLELKLLGSGDVLDMYPCYWYAMEAPRKCSVQNTLSFLLGNIKEEKAKEKEINF